jgi:hypothetical protein
MLRSFKARTTVNAVIQSFLRAVYWFPLLLRPEAATAITEGAVGTITSFRLYTVSYSTSATHDVAVFQMSPAMGNGCVWAWVDPSDTKALAVVLAAKTTGSSVTINFDNAVPSPWGDSSMCVLQVISLN